MACSCTGATVPRGRVGDFITLPFSFPMEGDGTVDAIGRGGLAAQLVRQFVLQACSGNVHTCSRHAAANWRTRWTLLAVALWLQSTHFRAARKRRNRVHRRRSVVYGRGDDLVCMPTFNLDARAGRFPRGGLGQDSSASPLDMHLSFAFCY